METMNLFENAIVSDNATITYRFREAVRHGRDAADTLALRPFLTSVETITEALNPTKGASGVTESAEGGTGVDNAGDAEVGNMSWRLLAPTKQEHKSAGACSTRTYIRWRLRRQNKNINQLALAPAKREHISAGACTGETKT